MDFYLVVQLCAVLATAPTECIKANNNEPPGIRMSLEQCEKLSEKWVKTVSQFPEQVLYWYGMATPFRVKTLCIKDTQTAYVLDKR